MINLILLIIGDLAVCALEGFYMGVGIRESAGIANITGMTIPTFIFWMIFAWLLRIYVRIPALQTGASPSGLPPDNEKRPLPGFKQLIRVVVPSQRLSRLGIVWLSTSLFAVFWQTWYWDHILQFDRGISLRFTFLFCLAGFSFLVLWRIVWSLFVILRIIARKNRFIRIISYLCVVLIILFQVPAIILTVRYGSQKYTLQEIVRGSVTLPYDTALVFGAGVYQNGTASSVLRDRVDTAVELYQSGQVKKLIMSGDNSDHSRNEVDVMTDLALKAGVPAEAILQDGNGMDTALTCFHALKAFDQETAVLVTQAFHSTRALYTCDQYGVKAVSVTADQSVYNIFSWLTWYLRDWIGLTLVWINYELLP